MLQSIMTIKTLLFTILCSLWSLQVCGQTPTPIKQRIASGTTGSDEIVIELLKRQNRLSALIAVSALADNPRYSNIKSLPSTVKGRVGGDLESLVALRPDLVILASYNRPELKAQLEKAGIAVHVLKNFATIDDVYANIEGIGHAIQAEDEAGALVQDMRQQLAALRQRVAKIKQRSNYNPKRVINFAADRNLLGAGTLFNEVVEMAGGINLAATIGIKGWQMIALEKLITLKPDVILVPENPSQTAKVNKHVQATDGFKMLSAVKHGRLIIVPEALFFTVSHHIVDLAQEFHRGLYGDESQPNGHL